MAEPIAKYRSEYLLASAGCGKTYALTKRYLALLLDGAAPESICALTFSRAATAEIFNAVLERLLETYRDLHEKNRDTTPVTRALKRFVAALPKLQISTLDAYVAKVAKLFAYELGVNPNFSLYDGANSIEGVTARTEIVRRALEAATVNQGNVNDIVRALSAQSDGSGDATALSKQLNQNFLDNHELVLHHPQGWGALDAIQADTSAPNVDKEEIEAWAERYAEKKRDPRNTFLTHALNYLHNVKDSSKLELLPELINGEIVSNKKVVELTDEEQRFFTRLMRSLLADMYKRIATKASRIHTALTYLETAYTQWQYETGMITFNELTELVSKNLGKLITTTDNPTLLNICFRLDARIHHLMIDEFQDTSKEQWQSLAQLAHELAEPKDPHEGSFFYVGDVKQSIYGWRGGDPTLFADTTRVPDIPAGAKLSESRRSSPAVLAPVNTIFNIDEATLEEAPSYESDVLLNWQKNWEPHASHYANRPGFSEFVALGGKNNETVLGELARRICERYNEIKASGRARSIAVLSLTKKTFDDDEFGLLKVLREANVPCAMDGQLQLVDTTLGALTLRTLQWMQAPDDTLHAEILAQLGVCDNVGLKAWATEGLRRLYTESPLAWYNYFYATLKSPCTATDIQVSEHLTRLFEDLTAGRSWSLDSIIEALNAAQVSVASDKSVVSLMTVHHSKGLTYDVVFSYFDRENYTTSKHTHFETSQPGDTPPWVLSTPTSGLAYKSNKALWDARELRREKTFNDSICALYVGITRARLEQHIYVQSSALLKSDSEMKTKKDANPGPKESYVTDNPARFLARYYRDEMKGHIQSDTFTLASFGDREWVKKPVPGLDRDQIVADHPTDQALPMGWRCRAEPSYKISVSTPSEAAQPCSVAELLAPVQENLRERGISIHAQLAAIEWTDTPPKGLFPQVFAKPTEPCEVWRERSFSVTLSKTDSALHYVSGQFDRVHLYPERRKACIYDFKTGPNTSVTPAHRSQLRAYREALTRLTGYAIDDIEMHLLFTRTGEDIKL